MTGFISIILATFIFFKISSVNDIMAYPGMYYEAHPVWEDLAFRKIDNNDEEIKFISKYKPSEITVLDNYKILDYGKNDRVRFTVIRIISKDGKLKHASANGCTWEHEFFNSLSKTEIDQLYSNLHEYYANKNKH